MKKIKDRLERIRNVGIIAHIDAGKTTVSERILYYTHKIHRMGEVHDGNTTMDFMPEEQERGITISAACTSCEWKGFDINLIDTPGHVDFTIEVERSLRVLDGAVGVFCAVGGVESQSETVWRQSEKLAVPKIAFINKMDRIGADFYNVLESLDTRLHAHPIAVQIPLGEGTEFYGVADLIRMQKLEFDAESQGSIYSSTDLDENESIMASLWRDVMLEKIADNDDEFLALFLEESYQIKDIEQALRRITLSRRGTPTLVGSALKNIGIQPVLDAICAYLPSISDVTASTSTPMQALVFKVVQDHGQQIAMIRMYAGELKTDTVIQNVTQNIEGKVHAIYKMHADDHEQVDTAYVGEIVAIKGLKHVRTGDTLGLIGDERLLEYVADYQPVIMLAFEPKNTEEGLILDEALERYLMEDPTLHMKLDDESGQRLVSGMGELHLDVLKERIQREYGIEPRVGNPQVVLRESICNKEYVQGHGLFDKELYYGEIKLRIKSRERGSGNVVEFAPECMPARLEAKNVMSTKEEIEKNILDTLLSGPQTGYPVQDVSVLIDTISTCEKTSSIGLGIAANMAIRDALIAARTLILQPIMRVEFIAPDEHLGACINAFNSSGGKVEQLYDKQDLKCVIGVAPMSQLFGFSTRIRSVSQGRVTLVMRFQGYNE